MTTMLALRKVVAEPGGLSLDSVAVPAPGPGEVCIEVSCAGICGTDLHLYSWVPFMRFASLPVVLGHELAGRIVEVGAGVSRVAIGDRVAADSHIPCWRCPTCLNEMPHVCPNTRYPGIHIDGGFARYVVLPQEILWKLDDRISFETGAMMEPFGIAVHAALVGTGVAGLDVAISGLGPIGMMNLLAARALGANRVIALDPNVRRLEHARLLGADVAIDPSRGDAAKEISELTRGMGVDVVFDYSGAATAIDLAGEILAPGGELRMLAVPGAGTAPDFSRWILKGLTVRALHGRRMFSTWLACSRLLVDRKVDLGSVVSDKLSLANAAGGFEKALGGDALKILVVPDA